MSLEEIQSRLNKTTPGPWRLHSIGAKNYLLWVGGNWPEEDDDANFDFIANAKTDIQWLIKLVEDLKYKNETLKIQLEQLTDYMD